MKFNLLVFLLLTLLIYLVYYVYYSKTRDGFVNKKLTFIPSENFTGAKIGYIFKNDTSGTGYYIDKLKL